MDQRFELKKFVAPEIIIGAEARLLAGRYIGHFNSKCPMIVTDKNVRKLSWFEEIYDSIASYAQRVILFDEVTPNPKDFEAMLGAENFLSNDCDLIIAIGGGSPIDAAKCISIVSTNGGHIIDYEGVDEINLPGPPLICIPSTAGTAADVSQFAIIGDTQEDVKRAIISKKVVPDLALIDPVPLMTMDRYLTACTGMDALTHAMEAYVSNAASALTDVHALEAIELISKNILDAVQEDRSLDTMYQMMLGSLQAGLAFSNASLGAVHAMAHSLGGLLDLAHGECNSILLEHVVKLNFDSAAEKYRIIADKVGLEVKDLENAEVSQALTNYISELRRNLGIEAKIPVESLSTETMEILVENALHDPCMITNPKTLIAQEVKAIYEKILQTTK